MKRSSEGLCRTKIDVGDLIIVPRERSLLPTYDPSAGMTLLNLVPDFRQMANFSVDDTMAVFQDFLGRANVQSCTRTTPRSLRIRCAKKLQRVHRTSPPGRPQQTESQTGNFARC